jgi:dihydroorotase
MWIKSVIVGGERVNIRMEEGRIREVSAGTWDEDPIADYSERPVFAAPGFVGLGVGMTAPGREDRDLPIDLANAAAAGGFTDVILVADGNVPFPDNAAVLKSARSEYAQLPTEFHFTGGTTVGGDGKEMAELYDMHTAGAVAFFDGFRPGLSPAMLARVLEYVGSWGGMTFQTPIDKGLAGDGMVNESPFTVRLGLRRIPPIAETVFVKTALEMVEYTGGRLHFTALTHADALEEVQNAARRGLDVSYDVSAHHFHFDDTVLAEFDSAFKLFPPLRCADNLIALKKAFWADATGFFSVQHLSRTTEEKELAFAAAEYGAPGLTTAAAASFESTQQSEWEKRWSRRPRQRLGLPAIEIRSGYPAKITLYETVPFIVTRESLRSKGTFSPYLGLTLPINIVGTVNGTKFTVR